MKNCMHRTALGYPRALDCGLRPAWWPALWRCGSACVLQDTLGVLVMGGIGKSAS